MKYFLLLLFINSAQAQQYIKNLTVKDLTATNAISGSILGNAATVTTNANTTGAVVCTGNACLLGSFSSSNLLTALSDETGSGSAVFANSPTLVTPNLGTPSTLVGTNITGTASGLTAGAVTTNANLSGDVTSSGNTTSYNGTVPVAKGGTGLTTLTANNVILGNGTSNPSFVAPGSSGNVLTSNGTTWSSSALSASLTDVPTVDGSGSPKIFGIVRVGSVCSASPCTPTTRLNTSVIASSTYTRGSTGSYDITLTGLTVTPVCSVVIHPIVSQSNRCQINSGISSSSVNVICFDAAGVTPVDEGFSLNCVGY